MSRVLGGLVAVFLIPSLAQAQRQVFIPPTGQVLSGGPQAPPRDSSAKTGTATIRGRVVSSENLQPLRKAQVNVFMPELRENRLATTDAQGRYEVKDLPAGRYTVTATKGSYVALQYGQTRPFQGGTPLEVLDGQTIEKVDFALPRGSVISGRVLDEFGDPLPDAQVSALRLLSAGGQRRMVPAGRSAATNDIGEFRLFALPPGQYYVSAILRNFSPGDPEDRSGYAPTYFPGTANVSEAQRVTVGLGQTVSDISMALTPVRVVRVSGTAFDSQGRPLSGVVTAIQRAAAMPGMIGPPGQIRADGSFMVSGLAPGDYTFTAQTGPAGESASADITVSGDDIGGIRLVGSRPSNVTGRLVVDATARLSLIPSTLRVNTTPAPVGGVFVAFGAPLPPAQINDDLTFEVKARQGRVRVNVMTPPGWTVKSVRHRGVDVTDNGIEIVPNEDVADVEVELTNRPTVIAGLVTNDRGETMKDYSVIVFAQDRARWTPGSRYLRTGRPDQDGRYKLSGLPEGDYYAVALEYVEQDDLNDPDFLDRARAKATRISVGDGDVKSLDLRLTSVI